jgi:hypothetical protein
MNRRLESPLRLGVIGLSEGNGHPYSWSAICNGYETRAMADCPYPAIPRYLARQEFPAAMLGTARVTHVWTQNPAVSAHIARAALIPNVVTDPEAMIAAVDAVLLARDDAENHLRFAAPFLDAGLPIYIDKPLALSRGAALELFARARYPSQLFSCSALRYAAELQLRPPQRQRVGLVRLVDCVVPKDWAKYAAHVIEPVIAQFCDGDAIDRAERTRAGGMTQLLVTWASGLRTRFTSVGTARAPMEIVVHGTEASLRMRFRHAFPAFKAALSAFVSGVIEDKRVIPQQETLRVVELIEVGCG